MHHQDPAGRHAYAAVPSDFPLVSVQWIPRSVRASPIQSTAQAPWPCSQLLADPLPTLRSEGTASPPGGMGWRRTAVPSSTERRAGRYEGVGDTDERLVPSSTEKRRASHVLSRIAPSGSKAMSVTIICARFLGGTGAGGSTGYQGEGVCCAGANWRLLSTGSDVLGLGPSEWEGGTTPQQVQHTAASSPHSPSAYALTQRHAQMSHRRVLWGQTSMERGWGGRRGVKRIAGRMAVCGMPCGVSGGYHRRLDPDQHQRPPCP